MLLVSFLVCSAGFTSNYFNLTNIFIQISGMNMDVYSKVFSTTQQNLTINSSGELVEDNNCYRVSYYIENETELENSTTTTCQLDNISNPYNTYNPYNPNKEDNENNPNITYSDIVEYILNSTNSNNTTIFKTLENLYLSTRTIKTNVRTVIEKRIEQFIEENKIDKDLINALKGVVLVNIILILGFGVAILVFSFSYKVMKDDFPEYIEDYVAYEDKYDKEFYDLERKELTDAKKEELKDNYVRDTTPNGEIIMYYDFETSSFKYYFNNKNAITYPELEAVAKLFTVKNNCRSLFIEDEKNSDNEEQTPQTQETPETTQPQETTQETPETEDEKPKKKSSVFAVVKKYNKQDNKSKDERDKHGKITRDSNKRSREENIERLDKVKKVGNHFKHVGKIYDFEEEQKGETIKQEILDSKPPPLPLQPDQSPPHLPPPPPEPSTETTKTTEPTETKTNASNNLKVFDDGNMVLVERPRAVSPPGKLLKKTPKIMPKNNISFAEYKKQVLEPNRKNK